MLTSDTVDPSVVQAYAQLTLGTLLWINGVF